MNFGEAKAALRSLINRKDITDDLAAGFINDAQTRLENVLRPSFLETEVIVSASDMTPGNVHQYPLPPDYLGLIALSGPNADIIRVEREEFLKLDQNASGVPCKFMQIGQFFRLRPALSSDYILSLMYYAAQPPLTVDTDTNAWTIRHPYALKFGAAIFAAHHFEDERLDAFRAQYTEFCEEIEARSQAENFSGPMRLQPSYSFQDCDYD